MKTLYRGNKHIIKLAPIVWNQFANKRHNLRTHSQPVGNDISQSPATPSHTILGIDFKIAHGTPPHHNLRIENLFARHLAVGDQQHDRELIKINQHNVSECEQLIRYDNIDNE
jgi:hypothetical protein